MKWRISLTCLLALLCMSAGAQNIKKHYLAKPQENGILYFVKPMKLFGNSKANAVVMDFTYLSGQDDIRINYSFTQPAIVPLDSIGLKTAGSIITCQTEKLFIEPGKRSAWSHRYSFMIKKSDAVSAFRPGSSTILVLYSGEKVIEYTPAGEWRKNTGILQSIFYLIDNNN